MFLLSTEKEPLESAFLIKLEDKKSRINVYCIDFSFLRRIFILYLNKHINMKLFKVFFPALFLIMALACGNDSNANAESNLILGRWELKEAKRNGAITESLEGAYFDFKGEGKLRTNLLGHDEANTYEIKDGKLFQKGKQNITYDIDQLDDKNLVISMKMRGQTFNLTLAKGE